MAVRGQQQIEIEGRQFAWRAVGNGPPLLLINGYAATGGDWDPTFLVGLTESFRVICPDNRGMGGSDLGDAELSVDGMAADLETLLDALGIPSLPVVGWSMGGFVAQRLAARSPQRVAALTLIATDPGGAESIPLTDEAWARLIDHSGPPREQASRLISLLFPPSLAGEIDSRFGEFVAEARSRLSPAALSAQEEVLLAWHREPQPLSTGGTPPTQILHGELDEVIPAANVTPLAARWPGARTEIFAGCGHAVMAQEPQRLVRLIGSL
jgi:pimeloyl-ACP methyl ester carboxylesterase